MPVPFGEVLTARTGGRRTREDTGLLSLLPTRVGLLCRAYAIFGNEGVSGIPRSLATFLRTWVVLVFAGEIVLSYSSARPPGSLPEE